MIYPGVNQTTQIGEERTLSAPLAAPQVTPKRPNVPEVRGQIPAEITQPSLLLGIGVFVGAASLYALTWWAILAAPWWPLQIAAAIANGLISTTLFVVGHDACHGSLTPSDRLNKLLGRLAFLPSLTPYVTWEHSHNRVHHSYTNFRPKDYAWAPFSKEEYDRLPWHRRLLERHYRTPLGLGSYYLVEYWWKHLLLPSRAELKDSRKPITYVLDLLLVLLFAAAQIGVIIAWSSAQTPSMDALAPFADVASLIIVAWAVPFLIWNWLMGFAIFQHHNHPHIAWYDDKEEWDFFAAQVESTVHVELPAFLEWISARIMHHTAHHVNPKIPLYRLQESQKCLEEAYPGKIVVQLWRLGTITRTMAQCKLYDYRNHRWLNFAGEQTAEPNRILQALREATRSRVETGVRC